MQHLFLTLIGLLIYSTSPTASADDQPLLARTTYTFDTAIDIAKQKLEEKGYTVVFTQKCDNALEHFQYATDSYRILMFSQLNFSRKYLKQHPEIAAFLPLRLAVFEEGNHTLLASYNPLDLKQRAQTLALDAFFEQWHRDISEVMQEMRQHEAP